MNELLNILNQQIQKNLNVRMIKENTMQVMLPIYYEDGDMVEVYVEPTLNGTYKISDFGMTLMRLSYYFEVNTDNKTKILNQIIRSNNLELENGAIYNVVDSQNLYAKLIGFCNVITKISAMNYFKREMIKNLFYEMLDEVITTDYDSLFDVRRQYNPLPGKDEYEVDYCLLLPKPIFIYAVKDTPKARLVTISAQEFMLKEIKSNSIVVYEDFSSINQNDQKRILNATGKQFTSLDEFYNGGPKYINGLLEAVGGN